MTRKNIFSDLLPPETGTYKTDSAAQKAKEKAKDEKLLSQPITDAPITSSSSPSKATKDKPHHTGRRDRLRQRFMEGGGDALADYEVVEMLLFLGIPRKDVKPLAKDLLKKFKTYPALLAAEPEDLSAVKGMTKNAVVALKLVRHSAELMMKQSVLGQPVLNSWGRLMDYLYATMAEEKKEHFRILFLDRKNNLIADEIQQTGTVDQTPVYPREIVKRALQLSATALILVHNHPSGDPSPSDTDIVMTEQIVKAAKALDIIVHDHVIVSRTGHVSFKNEGLL